jgi:HAD superfamily hydrolase (TIGR01490 family)
VTLAIFDLDNTLLAGDSDYLWGQFLARKGLVNADYYADQNQRFYDEYKAGTLDIFEFLGFSLEPLAEHDIQALAQLHRKFMAEDIAPIILNKGRELIEDHRARGHTLLIITATNRFVTEPIAHELGIDNLLATDAEIRHGRYTGAVAGTPCYREGKVTRLNQWLQDNGIELNDAWFYSDSHNDLPLLSMVNHPVAVDPDDILRRAAAERGWDIISLRDEQG